MEAVQRRKARCRRVRPRRPQAMNTAVQPPFLPKSRYVRPSSEWAIATSSAAKRSACTSRPTYPAAPRHATVAPGASATSRHGSRAATSRVSPGPAPRTVVPAPMRSRRLPSGARPAFRSYVPAQRTTVRSGAARATASTAASFRPVQARSARARSAGLESAAATTVMAAPRPRRPAPRGPRGRRRTGPRPRRARAPPRP